MIERVVVAAVTDRPISVDACAEAVAAASAGAVVTFAGVVRDHDEGKGVVSLEYTSHPTAGEVIRQVAVAVAEHYPEVVVAVAHRTGSLVVGDVALACAVASAHRSDAFAACSALVDAVKQTVPIWKHQRFVDGSSEWVASLG